MTKSKNKPIKQQPSDLFVQVKYLIEESRSQVAVTVNAALSMLYWRIGKCIREDILMNRRAGYGEQVIKKLSVKLTQDYGRGWSYKQLRHCLHSVETFPDSQ